MKITKAQLIRLCYGYPKDRIADDVRVFNEWADEFNITSPLRIAHFFAQLAHESGGFRYVEEIASGAAYDTGKLAIQLGNTPEKDGDGQKYKGRGYIQITGKANYKAYRDSGFCNGDVVAHPEWLCNSPGRMKSAMWFWWKNGLNKLADTDDVRAVTRKINGGYNGLSDRMYYLRKAKKIFV
jgi:putative chitinase